MNIFVLSQNPVLAAQYQCNKHVVKMILESAQMLSTAHRELDQELCNPVVYKATHKNHPCAVWARTSVRNYQWLYEHFVALCDEYTLRYGKIHLSYRKLARALLLPPRKLTQTAPTAFAQAMPDQYKDVDPVVAYRRYYVNEKLPFAEWPNNRKPKWIQTKTL